MDTRSALEDAMRPEDLGELGDQMFSRNRSDHTATEEDQPLGGSRPADNAASPSSARDDGSSSDAPREASSPAAKPLATGRSGPVDARPTFYVRRDQLATLRVVGSARSDPLGNTMSQIVQQLLDLFGYNGEHPAAFLHGVGVEADADVTGRLIEENQWKALLERAECMARDRGRPAAHMECLRFLVQEALYEAGYGDKRRRRKSPFA